MQTLTPSAQEGTEGLQGAQEVAQDLPPLVDGTATAKWVGAGSFIAIFIIVMILIIRGRVVRPAQRKAIKAAVFEPAGDDAEITFDDPGASHEPPPDPVEAEDAIGNEYAANDPDTDIIADIAEPSLNAERPADKPRRSPFAGLFSKKSSTEKSGSEDEEDIGALNDDEEDAAPTALAEDNAAGDLPPDGGDLDFSDNRRVADEEDAASLIAARELEEKRADEEARARAEHEAAFERRRSQAAIEQGLQSFAAMDDAKPDVAAAPPVAAMEDMLNQTRAALEDRMAALFDELDAKIENLIPAAAPTQPGGDQAVISEAHFAEFAELLSEQIAALRDGASTAIESLTHRIAQLETAPAGAAALSAQIADLNRILGGVLSAAPENQTRLADILSHALPSDLFSLSHKLSNGKIAAALVAMPGGAAPIVIADQFPIDAFAAYQRQRLGTGGGATAQNNFRNIMRRLIADAVEGFVVRGETGDHAFMLVPSEQLFASLHADFADLMQESHDAGLWMMSPTTLAATLQTVYVAASASHENRASGELLEEIIALRERVTTLEKDPPHGDVPPPEATLWGNGAPPASEREGDAATASSERVEEPAEDDNLHGAGAPPADTPEPRSPEEEAFERLEREETLAETGDKTRPEKGDRPHFPLR